MQRRIREVQTEQQMCIHKENLTELDIYHRILRYETESPVRPEEKRNWFVCIQFQIQKLYGGHDE